jgi:hypothetical protein
MVGTDDENGLGEETQSGFASDRSIDAYTSLHGLVLLSYGHRCALTGVQFRPATLHLHPDLDVVAIQPLDQGGLLSVSNCLPLLTSLRQLFLEGLITVTDDYRITVPHPEMLDPVRLASLRTSLALPDDPLLRPHPASLAHHRRYALGR